MTSDPKVRTTRFAMMDGVFPIGFYVGNAIAGPISKYLGFLYNFGLGMLFAIMGVAYVVFFVKDSRIIRDERLKREAEEKIQELKLMNKFEGEDTVQSSYL